MPRPAAEVRRRRSVVAGASAGRESPEVAAKEARAPPPLQRPPPSPSSSSEDEGAAAAAAARRRSEANAVDDGSSRPKRAKWYVVPPTVTYDEAPVYLRDNEYILSGYRTGYSYVHCMLSFFSRHNELTNMWSHGVGVIVFGAYIASLVTWLARSLVATEQVLDDGMFRANVEDVVILGVYYVCGVACMLSSTLYHTFSAHSEETMVFFIRCDLSGIAALVSGSLVVPVYYIFYCRSYMRAAYLAVSVAFLVAGTAGPQFPAFHTTQMRGVRALLYGGMAVSGVLPTLHSFFVLDLQHSLTMLAWILGMYASYGVALLFYIFRFPECRWPGTFDNWFQSHTWWHIFVLGGALVHGGFCWWIYNMRATVGCASS